jgi:molybdopterin-guanine dinucleotide biosynthesis protein A
MEDAGFLMSKPLITGVILAGGLGRRMGSVDKGLQLLGGQTLVQHVAERFAPQVSRLLINANQNIELYSALGYRVIPDLIPEFVGPLAGLHAALSMAETPLVASVPCDSPFLPEDLIFRLFSALTATNADLAVARTFAQTHPVFCLCKRELLANLSEFLHSGERKLGLWHSTLKTVEVAFDDEVAAFENINTREELGRFEGV